MLRKANNVFSVLLNDASKLTSALPATTAGVVVTDANLEAGAIVVTDLGLQRLSAAEYTALANGDQFLVVQGKGVGQPLMKSPVLTKGKIKLTAARFKAAVQQVTTIGYNGTTGALPVANSTDFWIKIRKRDNDAANRSQPMSLFAGPVRTDLTGTQAELATLLVTSGARNFKDEPANGYLKFEMICDNAGAASTAASGTITFTNGSRVITTSGVTPATDYPIGSFIRIGTTVTSPVYKVAAVSNALQTITLTSAYTGTTGTLTVTNHQFITAVLAAAANFGITITGKAAPFNVNTFRDYYANRFTATFSDSSTLNTPTMGARNGNGVWQQVAMDEYMNYGFEGQNNQLATPALNRDQVVKIPGVGTATALTSKYCALNIAWEESLSGLVSMAGGKGNVVVYINLTDSSGLGKISTPTTTTGNEFITVFGGPTAFGVAALTDLDEI
jgi:hypothetical protein